MADKLTIKTEDIRKGDSSYCWVNIELGGAMVGKARIKRVYRKIIIKSIVIFPEFERHGYAAQTVDLFKEMAIEIIADRVRNTARGFWERMGFEDKGDGNYRWVHDSR
ncbi:MAG: GNAT family N-acetyltransferase [Deltaproteobacteria bacterium]|nr:GNAT family N-acetyltransferase [Deltaproteobacteria bacterium]MBW2312483.1 GNAT family N-acetyltransferase [Deltaproteobacteria bacterium]